MGIFIDSDLVMRYHVRSTNSTFGIHNTVHKRFHITDALVNLRWVRVQEDVNKIAVLTCKVLHGIATEYLGPVVRVADLPDRQALRPAGTNRQVVHHSNCQHSVHHRPTRAFQVTFGTTYLQKLRQRVKTQLLRQSFEVN